MPKRKKMKICMLNRNWILASGSDQRRDEEPERYLDQRQEGAVLEVGPEVARLPGVRKFSNRMSFGIEKTPRLIRSPWPRMAVVAMTTNGTSQTAARTVRPATTRMRNADSGRYRGADISPLVHSPASGPVGPGASDAT